MFKQDFYYTPHHHGGGGHHHGGGGLGAIAGLLGAAGVGALRAKMAGFLGNGNK